MKRDKLTVFFFTFYIAILLLNVSSALGIVNKSMALFLNYGGFLLLLLAFMNSFYSINANRGLNALYKKSFQLPFFILVFYFVSVIVSLAYMNYSTLFIVLPNLIRCVVSIVVLNWLFCYILYKRKLNTYLKILTIVLAISASSIMIFNFLGLELSYLVYTDLQSPDGDIIGRSSGVFMNANSAAQFALYAIILLLYYIQIPGLAGKHKLLVSVFLVVCIYGILLTFSITGFANMILVFAYFVFNLYSSKIKFLIHLVLFLFCSQILILGLINNKETLYAKYNLPRVQQEKIDNLLNIMSFNGSTKIDYSNRDRLADKGLERIEQHPFFGFGAGEFMTNIIGGTGVHNTYLQIIGEAGGFVFVFYIVVIYKLVRRCYMIKNNSYRFLLASLVITTLIYQLTTHGILYNEGILLILIFTNCISIYMVHAIREGKHLEVRSDLKLDIK